MVKRREPLSFGQALNKELKKAGIGVVAAIIAAIFFLLVVMPMLAKTMSQVSAH